jgi:TonB family protein
MAEDFAICRGNRKDRDIGDSLEAQNAGYNINSGQTWRGVMAAVVGLSKSAEKSPPFAHARPQFVIQLEPAHRVFLSNLLDLLLRRRPRIDCTSKPAAFWPDVFVISRMPWLGFVESLLWHAVGVAGLWAFSHVWLLRPQLVTRPAFTRSDVLYYAPAEYLPPIDTGRSPARIAQKGEPEFAKQPIISVPQEPDNRSQTIITPPDVKLTHDVAVPNIVAWNAATPSVPFSATTTSRIAPPAPEISPVAPPPELAKANERRIAGPESAVIAPAPELGEVMSRHPISAPQVAVIAPPPMTQGEIRKIGDINIGQAVVAPAPQLPMPAQRVPVSSLGLASNSVVPPPPSLPAGKSSYTARTGGIGNAGGEVVPPPPSMGSMGNTAGSGRIIALGIHPSAAPPPSDLAGNRRGTFAASPEGKAGASGKPEITASSANGKAEGIGGNGNGHGPGSSGRNSASNIPSGIYVGAGPNHSNHSAVAGTAGAFGTAGASNGPLVADTRPMRVMVTPHNSATSNAPPSEIERSVFHNRKSYSMILNMPNLNSAGGSWIIRFAEKAQDDATSDLTAPEATRKVDPGYPAELMRQNVHGTVILYAVIHRDGSVGDVRILSSADERLDQFARAALTRWQFHPATKNGNAVDLEAVVTIPFRAKTGF